MELADIEAVNDLFTDLYPYIAEQIAAAYRGEAGLALEVGPYGPGISIALARRFPAMRFAAGDDFPGILAYMRRKVAEAGLEHCIELSSFSKHSLPFPDATFDLAYFRGALFFWDDAAAIVREMQRVMRPGGLVMPGGGFGAEAPDALIEAVLPRSHELNRRLKKRVFTDEDLQRLLAETGLSARAHIDRRHGLWLVIRN